MNDATQLQMARLQVGSQLRHDRHNRGNIRFYYRLRKRDPGTKDNRRKNSS
jgi:hypothetical protein